MEQKIRLKPCPFKSIPNYCVEYEGWGVVLILCCDKCGKIKKVRCL